MLKLYQQIRTLILLINLGLVLGVALILSFTSNIQVIFFQKNISFSFISNIAVICVLLLLIMAACLPLTKKMSLTFLSIFSLVVTTIFTLYNLFTFYNWFNLNVEGVLHYRFITIIKTASLEAKISQYNLLLTQNLDLLLQTNKNNIPMVSFLKNYFIVTEPSALLLSKTLFVQINDLVNSNIDQALNAYKALINKKIPEINNPWNVKKICLYSIIGLFTLVGVYYLGQLSWAKYIKQSLEISKNEATLNAEGAKNMASVITDIKTLSESIVTIGSNTKLLKETVELLPDAHHTQQIITTVNAINTLLSTIIQPCMRSYYTYMAHINSHAALMMFSSLTEEQKEFISLPKKLILTYANKP